MATNYKITYKNHCTPQEYITENSRWYLDSDIGVRLTGTAIWGPDSSEPSGTFADGNPNGVALTSTAVALGTDKDFVYIKNLGKTVAGEVSTGNILISFADEDADGSEADGYRIRLGSGECFASRIATHATILIKSDGDDTSYECVKGT